MFLRVYRTLLAGKDRAGEPVRRVKAGQVRRARTHHAGYPRNAAGFVPDVLLRNDLCPHCRPLHLLEDDQ